MKNARRSAVRIALAALTITALSACGGSERKPEGPGSGSTSSADTTLESTTGVVATQTNRDTLDLGMKEA